MTFEPPDFDHRDLDSSLFSDAEDRTDLAPSDGAYEGELLAGNLRFLANLIWQRTQMFLGTQVERHPRYFVSPLDDYIARYEPFWHRMYISQMATSELFFERTRPDAGLINALVRETVYAQSGSIQAEFDASLVSAEERDRFFHPPRQGFPDMQLQHGIAIMPFDLPEGQRLPREELESAARLPLRWQALLTLNDGITVDLAERLHPHILDTLPPQARQLDPRSNERSSVEGDLRHALRTLRRSLGGGELLRLYFAGHGPSLLRAAGRRFPQEHPFWDAWDNQDWISLTAHLYERLAVAPAGARPGRPPRLSRLATKGAGVDPATDANMESPERPPSPPWGEKE